MKLVQVSEAKTHLPKLLDEVERGETIVITRHGRAIARLVPETELRQQEVEEIIGEIRRLRTQTVGMTTEEILTARNEGRKR